MNRREFARRTAVTAVATSWAAPFVHADDKSGTKPPVIGAGEHQYECHHGWGDPPKHIHWFETHGVAVDREGLVYVTHRAGSDKPKSPADAQDTVVVFTPEGKFVRSFGKQWHGGGHGIDIRVDDGTEYLYLCMMFPINLIVKTDLKGEIVWVKDRSALADAHVYDDPKVPFAPTNLAFAPDGGFYVGDGYGSSYVHQFDKNAKWVRTWGGTGDEPGKMKTPHGIIVDSRPDRTPEVVVADRANARLQEFALNGQHVGFNKNVLFPAHFDIRGDVLMVPDLHARVSLFDKANQPIVHLGDDANWIAEVKKMQVRTDPKRWPAGKFVHPHDACFDTSGHIYVTEWVVPGRISFLRHLG